VLFNVFGRTELQWRFSAVGMTGACETLSRLFHGHNYGSGNSPDR